MLVIITILLTAIGCQPQVTDNPGGSHQVAANSRLVAQADGVVRFATFNVSLYRKSAGDLIKDLESGQSKSAKQVAEVIQRVRPDVLLLNEFDFDAAGPNGKSQALALFTSKYLAVSQNGQSPIDFPYSFVAPVNTGVDSGLDLNGNGKTGEPDDGFGFGRYPGQYGMAVLAKHPIQTAQARSFQKFLWKQMPDAMWPTQENGEDYYSAEIQNQFRLSSKSHWIVPIQVADQIIYFVVAHPTPPVFDGPEDRNGKRNHDEIRFLADIVSGAEYPVDDQGQSGGLPAGAKFVVAGDLNADPHDGDSAGNPVQLLLEHKLINAGMIPSSNGAVLAAKNSGKANDDHAGDPAHDTGDFNDNRPGNLRIDYVLPSKNLELVSSGVFWPAPDEPGHHLNDASDHHLVWIDIQVAQAASSK